MTDDYNIADLVHLVVSEGADKLSLHTGKPPIIHIRGEAGAIEGPAIVLENADAMLRALAGTRYMREFHERGSVTFLQTFKDSLQFRVNAKLEHDEIWIEIEKTGV